MNLKKGVRKCCNFYDFSPLVIPAKAGIQNAPEHSHVGLDSRFRGNDRIKE